MSYKNKTYIAFDGDNDMKYYRMMTALASNQYIDFDFYNAHELNCSHDWARTESIKRQLHERLENSKLFILLIGTSTKRLTRFVKYEVETAMRMNLPIICVNFNGNREIDNFSPDWFGDYPRIYVPFKERIIKYAMDNWPNSYNFSNGSGSYCYKDSVYSSLGINRWE